MGEYLLEWMNEDTFVFGLMTDQFYKGEMEKMDTSGSFLADCLHTCLMLVMGGYTEKQIKTKSWRVQLNGVYKRIINMIAAVVP